MNRFMTLVISFLVSGCIHYSDNPPPPDGAKCSVVDDCGPRGACWQWTCAGTCVASVSPDLDNDDAPVTCAMAINGAAGTCHSGRCVPDDGETATCEPGPILPVCVP